MMLSGRSKFVLKSEELCYIKLFFSLTGLERSTTREDQMEMIFTGRMYLILGWNSVTRYGVCSQFFFFKGLIVPPILYKIFNFTGARLHESSNLYNQES